MAKKTHRRTKPVHHKALSGHKRVRTYDADGDTVVMVRGWMFVVAFALMLGIGAIVGTFTNRIMNESQPTVAGVQTEIIR